MKRYLILFFGLIAIGALNAQETYRFRTDRPQGISIENSSPTGLSLHYSIQEIGIANINNDEAKGHEIILKGQFAPNGTGRPNLPVVNRYIAIPQGATVSLQYKENASTTINGIDMLPAMPLRSDLAEGPLELTWDSDIYSKDANFPTKNIVLTPPTQIRSLDVVLLSITPFRYNPVKRTLEVIYDIDIDIRFEGGNGQFGEGRYFNPDWEHILRNLVVNSEMIAHTDYYDLVKSANDRDEEGCEYLIITPNNTFAQAWADTLKAFRTKQGISTKVVTVSQCGGNDPNIIRNYILNAYNTWAVPPAAVLIFGGYYSGQGVKPFYHNSVAGDYGSQVYTTDYPFCDMNGDSIADLALSRITARNAQEYKVFVEKTIQYESNPPADPGYYDHPIISSGHEDNKWFMISSQSINGFYRDHLGKHPTDLYMVNSGSIPDSIWSTGFNSEVLMDYFGPNGCNYIPQSIGELHDWRSKNDTIPLHNAINAGSFLTLYRDHSNYNAWWCPSFKSLSMDKLINNPLTFVLSISCSCSNYTNSGRGLVDAFCLKPNGGAVGGIGAVCLTHSYLNDILTWGFYDCIWPDFLPDMGSTLAPDFVRPAYALSEAKTYFAYHSFIPDWWVNREESTMHIFCYTGETYLNLYTETPQPLQITHGQYMPKDANEFIVNAEEGAVVCLSRNGEIIGVARSNGQPLSFSMPTLMEGQKITITATKQNHFRYEDEIGVVSDNGPYVVVERDGILAENEYDMLHYGENAHVGIVLHNYGNDAATNITMSLTCPSQYIEVTQGNCQYHNLASNQSITISDAFQFEIAENVPDMTQVTFIVTITDDSGERECYIKLPITAPSLVIKPNLWFTDRNQQSMLQLNKEGASDIHLQIANKGHFDSDAYNLQLEMMAPFMSVDNPSRMFSPLQKGSINDVVFRIHSNNSTIDEGWILAKFKLDDGIHQYALDTMLPMGGFNETFDPGYFNLHNWQMSGNAPWAETSEDPYDGEYCAKSGVITHNQSSEMSITQTTSATEISFFKKVSSETNYDKLHFYIDGEDMGEWSGTLSWNEERYRISAGTHTFKWSYIKDYSVNLGSDCAWIDNINIEPSDEPVFYSGGTLIACNDEDVHIDCNYLYNYQNLSWTTAGDGQFVNDHARHPIYTPGPQDIANGGTTLTLHIDGEESPLQLILVDEISMGTSINGDAMIDPEETSWSHYSVASQAGIRYLWQLEPEEAGRLFPRNNGVDIVWTFADGITEATLTVTADANCSESLSKNIQIDIYSTGERSNSCFTLFPNPTDGTVNLTFGKSMQSKSVVEVYNVLGTRMMGKTFQNLTEGQNIQLDLQHFAPGIYIVKLCNDEGCWSQKVSVR